MGVMLMAGRLLSTGKFLRVNQWVKNTHEWFLPSSCVLCGRAGRLGQDLCADCAGDLPYLKVACHRCAIPLPQAGVCGQCQQKPHAFDSAWAAFDYLPPVDHLVQLLKFNGKLYSARLLGELMAERIAVAKMDLPELLLPVPLHASRIRQRGFNQALELARPLACEFDLPLKPGLCRRLRPTMAQTGLDAKARRRNLKGVFEVVAIPDVSHVAIIDDVMTTGSTAEMLAKVLKNAGVARVDVWVCARAALRGRASKPG